MFHSDVLYPKDPFIRYLRNTKLIDMTVCIAGICNVNVSPTILLCADRLVSAGVQFEGGSSKILQITKNCAIMHSSDDSVTSELVLQRLLKRTDSQKKYTPQEIANMLCEECITLKQEKQVKDVLSKYNVAINGLKADPNNLISDAVNDLKFYQYPAFEFIVAGLDEEVIMAHIFKVDQDGNQSSWDSIGFATTGSGGSLAFLELTKWFYSITHELSLAIPRLYFAKKVSERATGVGRYTDYVFLSFQEDENKIPIANMFTISTDQETIKKLDEGYQKLGTSELAIITELKDVVTDRFKQRQEEYAKSQQKTNN